MYSYGPDRHRRQRQLAAMAIVVLALGSGSAHAATAPVSGQVLVRFGATYEVSGRARTHEGADLEAATGASAASPVDGVVVFSGQVPAHDSSGLAVGCVTVQAGGDRWSLLPLDRLSVRAGDGVAAGRTLGTVSDKGDVSCPSPHLHLGLRREGRYIDPAAEFEASSGGGAVGAGGGSAASGGDGAGTGSEQDAAPTDAQPPPLSAHPHRRRRRQGVSRSAARRPAGR